MKNNTISVFKESFEKWEKIRKDGWNKSFETQINYFFKIKKNIPIIVDYYSTLTEEQKEFLKYPTSSHLYWRSFENNIISKNNLIELARDSHKHPGVKDKKIKEEKSFNYHKQQLKKISDIDDQTLDDWITEEKNAHSKVDHYLEQSKKYYAMLIEDEKIEKIIDIIVDTLNVNSTKSSIGSNKKCINMGDGIYYVFELFIPIKENNLLETEKKIKNTRFIKFGIVGEVFGFYNLTRDGFIYNNIVANFIKEKFNVKKATKPSDISVKYYEFREIYKECFKNYLEVEIINKKISGEGLRLSKGELENVQLSLQTDQFISWFERVNTPDKSKKADPSRGQNNNMNKTPSNFILYGPPGTGKTYKTVDIAACIIGGSREKTDTVEKIIDVDKIYGNDDEKEFHKDNTTTFNDGLNNGRIHFVTFHQNYSYEEFVGGLRPDEDTNDKLRFKWKPGIFIKACAEALELARKDGEVWSEETESNDKIKSPEDWFFEECKNYNPDNFKYGTNKQNDKLPKVVLIIDEINRANISRVFGELITLIEGDKRIGGKHQLILTLPNGKKFGVPANLIIMGTMNTADKSLALLDVALRRRFEFKGLFPKEKLVKDKTLNKIFQDLNQQILLKKKSSNLLIGHSYFMDKNEDDLETIFNKKIIPLLNEYFMGNRENVEKLLAGIVATGIDANGVLKCIKVPPKNTEPDNGSENPEGESSIDAN